jgi:hypothetical protein
MYSASSNENDMELRTYKRPPSYMRKRLMPIDPPHMRVEISIPSVVRERQPRSYIGQICVGSFFHYLLYTRGVIPSSVSDLMNSHQQDTSKSISIPREERASIKCGGLLHQLEEQWEEVMESDFADQIGAVLITFGQWWSRPREQYVIYLNGLGQDHEISDNDCGCDLDNSVGTWSTSIESVEGRKVQKHSISRRLLASFLNSINEDSEVSTWMATPSYGASCYQGQISFWVPRTTLVSFYSNSKNSTKYIVRRNFSIYSHLKNKVKPAMIEAELIVDGVSLDDEKWDESSGIWMSMPTAVKGYQLTK